MATPSDKSKSGRRRPRAQPVPPRKGVIRYWTWELLSLFLASGLIATIIAVLAHYQGQVAPEWPFSINLSTLIATLSTILRASILVAVAEILSQLKYSWFSQPRPLKQLDDFEWASRSILGSFRLLFVATSNPIAVVSALVFILTLAVGPVTQQAIKSVTCSKPMPGANANASLPVSHFFPAEGRYYRAGPGQWEMHADMKGAMIDGLTNPKGNDSQIMAICPTGNCTFVPQPGTDNVTHSSIGLCNACIETTSLVKNATSGITANYTLPNQLYMSPTVGSWSSFHSVQTDLNLTWAESVFTDEFRAAVGAALINLTVFALTQAPCRRSTTGFDCPRYLAGYSPGDYVATSCALYPCLKNFNAAVRGGVLIERVVSTTPAPVNRAEAGLRPGDEPAVDANYTALRTPCTIDNVTHDAVSMAQARPFPGRSSTEMELAGGKRYRAPDECVYKLSWVYGSAMASFMREVFDARCVFSNSQAGHINCQRSWYLEPLFNDWQASFGSISAALDQFAAAMTTRFRKGGSSNDDPKRSELALGHVSELTVCTAFEWRWLILPIALLATSVGLLAAMMWKNLRDPRQPVWKSSLLPLLLFGFGPGPIDEQGQRPLLHIDQVDDQARRINTVFDTGHNAGFVDVDNARNQSVTSVDTILERP